LCNRRSPRPPTDGDGSSAAPRNTVGDPWPECPPLVGPEKGELQRLHDDAEVANVATLFCLLRRHGRWEYASAGRATRALAWLPADSLRQSCRHIAWGNATWCGLVRVYAFDFDRILRSFSGHAATRYEPGGSDDRLAGFEQALRGGERAYPREIAESCLATANALTAGAHATTIAYQFAEALVPYCVEGFEALRLDGYPELRLELEKARLRVYGGPWELATGCANPAKALTDARAVDALRVPFPDLRETRAELELKHLAAICAPHPVDALPLDEPLAFILNTIRSSVAEKGRELVQLNVPRKARACAEGPRGLGGVTEVARNRVAGALRAAGNEAAALRFAFGAAAAPTPNPTQTAIDDSILFDRTMFELVERHLESVIERGEVYALFGAIRPEREGGKCRAFDVFVAYEAFAARLACGVLVPFRRLLQRGPTLDQEVSRETLGQLTRGLARCASEFGKFYVASPDGTRSTDLIPLELTLAVCMTCLELVPNEELAFLDFEPDRVRAFIQKAFQVYASPVRSAPHSSAPRVKFVNVFRTELDFAPAPRGEWELELEVRPRAGPTFSMPRMDGRAGSLVTEPGLLVGATGSGKSTAIAMDLARALAPLKLRAVMIQPRVVAAHGIAEGVRRLMGTDCYDEGGLRLIGLKTQGVYERGVLTIATPGAALGLVRNVAVLVLDEAHEDSDEYEALRAIAADAHVPVLEVTATPLPRHEGLPRWELGRFDGRERVVRRVQKESFDEALDAGLAKARATAGRLIVMRPAIRGCNETAQLLREMGQEPILVIGGMPGAELAAAASDNSSRPIVGTLILASSITIPDAKVIVIEDYAWCSVYDPYESVTGVVTARLPPHMLAQLEGRVARVGSPNSSGLLVGWAYVGGPQGLEELALNAYGPRAAYCDLTAGQQAAYPAGDIASAYFAAALHDAPLTRTRSRTGGSPSIRALMHDFTPIGSAETAAIAIEVAYRAGGGPAALGRARANLSSAQALEAEAFLVAYEAARPELVRHAAGLQWLEIARQAADAILALYVGLEPGHLAGLCAELEADYPEVLPACFAAAFPGEVAFAEGGKMSFLSRPGARWDSNAKGFFLVQRVYHGGAITTFARPVEIDASTRATIEARAGTVYVVPGSSTGSVAVLTRGGHRDQTRLRFRYECVRAPVLDYGATLTRRLEALDEHWVAFIAYVLAFGLPRRRGSPQSHVLSFQVLNMLTGIASTEEALRLAIRVARRCPAHFANCGVPAPALAVLGDEADAEPDLRVFANATHGDDRVVAGPGSAIPLATGLAMLLISRCPVSPKSGSCVMGVRGKHVLATFAAHALSPTGAYVVSLLRQSLKCHGFDGISPSMNPRPSWLGVARRDICHATFIALRARVLRETAGQSLFDLAPYGIEPDPSDAYGTAFGVARALNCRLPAAIGVALATHKMNSAAPKYRNWADARRALDASEPAYDLTPEGDESHLDVYEV